MKCRIGAVITVAGLSSRMQDYKPLMLLGNKLVINHVIDNFRNIGISYIPLIKKSTLLYMKNEFIFSGYSSMVPSFEGRKGHPILIREDKIDKILQV